MNDTLQLAKNVMKPYPMAVQNIVDVFSQNDERGLTLATLCDMVLGEDAEDRSDDALIRRVRELQTFWEAH